MDKQKFAAIAVAAVVAALFGSAGAASEQPVLEGRAILPAETFALGPPSGAFIGGPVINGLAVPFASQPVQGFSALLPRRPSRLLGHGGQRVRDEGQLADFLLRMYRVTPQFKTAHGGTGTVSVGDFIQLSDQTRRFRSRSRGRIGS
jgi:glycerophosphoryl diester phosphodiesterase